MSADTSDDTITLSTGAVVSIETIKKHTYAKGNDLVIVAGTLVEGIGNPFSDVDVYVLCSRRPRVGDISVRNHLRVFTVDHKIVDERYAAQPENADDEVLLVHADTEYGGVKIDVEFKTYDEVQQLSEKVNEVFQYAKMHLLLLTVGLAERDKMFLHRLRFCRVIQGCDKYRNIVDKFSFARYNYLLYRWLASDYSVFLDIVGAAASGEWLRAIELARINVLHQTLAFLNLVGVSNFDPKWLLTYIESAMAIGYFDRRLKAEFDALYCCRGIDSNDREEMQRYVERSLDYVDSLFQQSRDYLVRNPLLFNLRRSYSLVFASNENEQTGLYSALERAYRGKAYGFTTVPARYLLRAYVANGEGNNGREASSR